MDSKSLLVNVAPEKVFYMFNGKHIKNLKELVSELESITQEDFSKHCNSDKDDFSTWIDDALGFHELASSLNGIIDKEEYAKTINLSVSIPHETQELTENEKKAKKHPEKKLQKKAKEKNFPKPKKPEKRDIKEKKKAKLRAKKIGARLKDEINQEVLNALSKERTLLNEELNKITLLNSSVNRRLNIALNNRTMQIEKAARQSIDETLKEHLATINNRVEKLVEAKIAKLEQSFGNKTEIISAASLNKFKRDINSEKHNLHAIASEVMHREFNKLLENDEKLHAVVSKYQKMFSEDAENIEKTQKENEIRFVTEINSLKNKALTDSQAELKRQLEDTMRKQRELLDNELAKTLSSNKFFYSRYEKEILNREKLFRESAEKQLNDNFARHEDMLSSKYDKFYHDLLDLKVQLDKNFAQREERLTKAINAIITEELNKEFGDVLLNQRNELAEAMGKAKEEALGRINTEFNELFSKQKKTVMDQTAKVSSEHQLLKEKFIIELKTEQGNILSSVKELMKKELAATILKQRELMDKELEKTVLANKYFVERFEKEISEMSRKLEENGNKLYEENYAKHKKTLDEINAKQLENSNRLIANTGAEFSKKESEIYSNVTSAIQSSVREAVNKEFGALIANERKALEAEIAKAEENNRNIEEKFEQTLQEKAQELIKTISDEANARFSVLMTIQQNKLEQELLRAKKSYDIIEEKKKDIIDKTNSFLGNMSNYSANKLKELEKEHNKHLKKVSQLSELITKTKDALNDLKNLKAELNSDKKNISKDSQEYNELIEELTTLRDNLSKEKNWISMYRAKVNIYLLVRKCSDYIKEKDATNAKLTYNKIAEMYARTPFEKNDKVEIYNAALELSKEIQTLVSVPLDNSSQSI